LKDGATWSSQESLGKQNSSILDGLRYTSGGLIIIIYAMFVFYFYVKDYKIHSGVFLLIFESYKRSDVSVMPTVFSRNV